MLDLPLVKQHCRIEPDFSDDDVLLQTYAVAALRYVENFTGCKLREVNDQNAADAGEYGLMLTDDIKTAALFLIAHWYANREPVTIDGSNAVSVPFAVEALLQPYRVYGV